jgi:hypothetical protein
MLLRPDSLGPIVSPFDHGARFEVVAAHFVDVVLPVRTLFTQSHFGPVARKKLIWGQFYQTFNRKIFSSFLLSLVILKYRQYFLMLQTLNLNNKNLKTKKNEVCTIDSWSLS